MFGSQRFASLLLAASLVGSAFAGGEVSEETIKLLPKRQLNNTEVSACFALSNLSKDSISSAVYFVPLSTDNSHWMSSSNQASACIYTPATPNDLAAAIKLISQRRIRFAVSCSNHASNQGFSSTPGIHISLHKFTGVTVSADKTYADIGGGLSWADVYNKLEPAGVNTVGGRVNGPGIGGFVTGGGGFSWKTNQHGLTCDNLIAFDIVLGNGTITSASASYNADLWWAVRGGGNRFGTIFNFRMATYPQSPSVYAGLNLYGADKLDAVLEATYKFAVENTDPLAQVIPTINYAVGGVSALVLGVYDGVPKYGVDPFPGFDLLATNSTFASFVGTIQSAFQGGNRGAFHSTNVVEFSRPVLAQIANQTAYWGKAGASHSASFVSYDIEPFLQYSQYTKDAPYPHSNNPQPLNLYFAWSNEADDEFWHNAMIESANIVKETARADGQNVDQFYTYPNYALGSVKAKELFGTENTKKLEAIRQKYDPSNTMLLTTCFDFIV